MLPIMSIQAIYRYLFILITSMLLLAGSADAVLAQAPATADTTVVPDSTADEPEKKKIAAGGHQLCIGADLLHAVLNTIGGSKSSYELEAHYYLKNEYYAVAEGGWGSSTVNYTDLKYNTTNNFFRLGFNKSILARERPSDWDMMFVGFRAGYAGISRTAGTYTVVDSVWGNSIGTSPARSFGAVWAEITLGMRVELLKGLMAGWNIRGKFLLNGKSFQELSPLNIAGYGRGDKNANFDFNVYLSYAIRWSHKLPQIKSVVKPPLKAADKL